LNLFRCFYLKNRVYLCVNNKIKPLILLVSLNHKNTTLVEREPFYFDDIEKEKFYLFIRGKLNLKGIFLLSTCNRSDFYFHFDKKSNLIIDFVIKLIESFKKNNFNRQKITIKTDLRDITTNIFRTACGIESMVIGEYEIVDQIKKSLNHSIQKKYISPLLNRLIQKSLECSKYVRTNTMINKGSTSVSSVLINNLSNFYSLNNKSVMIVGAGKMSKLSIRHLKSKTTKKIYVTNRSSEQLEKLYNLFDITKVSFKNYIQYIPKMDFVIFLTSSKKPLITDEDLALLSTQISKKIMFIDLSVPRNIKIERFYENITEFNLDNLKSEIESTKKYRSDEIEKAEKFIQIFQKKFDDWFKKYNNIRQNKKSEIKILSIHK